MKKCLTIAAAAFALTSPVLVQPVLAQEEAQEAEPALSPGQIVDEAPASDWVNIAAEDLLVMTLTPDRDGNARKVVIQLMPAPFSQGWVENIRTLARAGWYDGISVNRVQDNYVVQWGDANVDNPTAEGEAKPLPEGLRVMDEGEYIVAPARNIFSYVWTRMDRKPATRILRPTPPPVSNSNYADAYSDAHGFVAGIPIAVQQGLVETTDDNERIWSAKTAWPVHCYGMVGVGRSYSPDTGTGAELYTVIGHAPRHLDRNIALVGRVIEGIEHLSSLPRGTGPLGFYETAEERVPIQSIAVADNVRTPPEFEYLSTESETFARYADARANRRDPFFIVPAGGADICNIPVPVRRLAE